MKEEIAVHKPITTQYGKVTYYRKPRPWTEEKVRKLMSKFNIPSDISMNSLPNLIFNYLEKEARERAKAAGKTYIIPEKWEYGRKWVADSLESMVGAVGFAWSTTNDASALALWEEL